MNGASPTEAVVSLHGLERRYQMGDSEVAALAGVDLTIARGEFVAIVGPSGSGKSTLMYLLGCLDSPTAGSLRLLGSEAAGLADSALSRLRNRAIGFVFQQFFLLPQLDLVENVALVLAYAGVPGRDRRRIARSLLEQVGLGDRLHHRPNQLSGGQMQRAAIARALAADPGLLLADEPTGNLDSRTSAEIMDLLTRLHAGGTTVVVVTHDPNVAARARRVVSLKDGLVVSDRQQEATPSAEPLRLEGARAAGRGGLGWTDLLRMALREGLLAHRLRSSLTMLGIAFGIAAVVAMTAITEGGKQQQLAALRQIGLNTVRVEALDLPAASLARERRRSPAGVCQQDLDALRQHLDGVVAATAWKQATATVRNGGRAVADVPVLGVLGDFVPAVDYHVAAGRFLDAADAETCARVCVLGPAVADRLGLEGGAVGGAVVIGDQSYTVVGVMERKAFDAGAGGVADLAISDRTREVYVPWTTLRRFVARSERASDLDVIHLGLDREERLLPGSRLARHIVASLHDGAADFEVSVPLEKLKQAQQTKEVFNVIITVIAGISLVVGGIGIMNIMLASVTERTREIGLRRAIGASRRVVLAQFLTEAGLLSAAGGAAGLLAGWASGMAVEVLAGFPVAFSTPIAVVALVVSAVVGIAFGLYPAWMAATRDPVESLRN